MKTFGLTAIILALLILSCQNLNKPNPNLNDRLNGTLHLFSVFGSSESKSSKLIIKNDTAFFITATNFNGAEKYSFRRFYFDSAGRTFLNWTSGWEDLAEMQPILAYSKDASIYFPSLGESNGPYPHLPEDLKSKGQLKRLIDRHCKAQLYDGKYYFLGSEYVQEIFVYDPSLDTLSTYKFEDGFTPVINFLLVDLDKDKKPEIFIFSTGDIPRDDAVSCDIYSLRREKAVVKSEVDAKNSSKPNL